MSSLKQTGSTRVRYAPSPTGYLHLGNARTALFNFLYARHFHGVNILRCEDTDMKRNVEGALQKQIANLAWLGIVYDEYPGSPGKYGPYRQSERLAIYQKHAQDLLKTNQAYRCFCSDQEIEKERNQYCQTGQLNYQYSQKCRFLTPNEIAAKLTSETPCSFVIRIKTQATLAKLQFHDLIRGSVELQRNQIGDWVILRSNGVPTYNFAAAVDDHLMKISHVIRGAEHIGNTFNQMLIYEAFKWELPCFAHLPLIVDEHQKKLSKRSGKTYFFCSSWQEQGFLPAAVFNFISFLGWSPPSNQEIMSAAEITKKFSFDRVSKGNACFSQGKLEWFNSSYIKNLSANSYQKQITPFVKRFLQQNSIISQGALNRYLTLALAYQKQIKRFCEIEMVLKSWIDGAKVNYQDLFLGLEQCHFNQDYLTALKGGLQASWGSSSFDWHFFIKELKQKTKRSKQDLFMPVRILSTLHLSGPELKILMPWLGRNQVFRNIQMVADRFFLWLKTTKK